MKINLVTQSTSHWQALMVPYLHSQNSVSIQVRFLFALFLKSTLFFPFLTLTCAPFWSLTSYGVSCSNSFSSAWNFYPLGSVLVRHWCSRQDRFCMWVLPSSWLDGFQIWNERPQDISFRKQRAYKDPTSSAGSIHSLTKTGRYVPSLSSRWQCQLFLCHLPSGAAGAPFHRKNNRKIGP